MVNPLRVLSQIKAHYSYTTARLLGSIPNLPRIRWMCFSVLSFMEGLEGFEPTLTPLQYYGVEDHSGTDP